MEQIICVEHEFSSFAQNDWGGLKQENWFWAAAVFFIMGASSSDWQLYTAVSMVKVELMEEIHRNSNYCQNGGIDLMIDSCQLDKTAFDSRVYRTEYLLLAVPSAL